MYSTKVIQCVCVCVCVCDLNQPSYKAAVSSVMTHYSRHLFQLAILQQFHVFNDKSRFNGSKSYTAVTTLLFSDN